MARRNQGFTLVEMIVVIVLMGIIAAVVTPLIANKFSAVSQSTDRSRWVQQAEYAMTLLRQDLGNSVPNSICTDNNSVCGLDNQVVEFLAAPANAPLQAARYRNKQFNPYDRLRLNNETSFDIFAFTTDLTSYVNFLSVGADSINEIRTDWETGLASGNGSIARINNATPLATGENASPLTNIELAASNTFRRHSPHFRVYFFRGPLAYQCDTGTGFLYRITGYTSLSNTSFASRTSAATKNRVISNIQRCSFELITGANHNPPMLRVRLEIGDSNSSVQLIDTIPLSNAL
jgi:MSHA biogenesis protein MshO